MSQSRIEALEARISELEAALAQASAPRAQKSHRKYEVLAALKTGPMGTAQLAQVLNTTKGNIGSLLTYLRHDGVVIHRDHLGRHYLVTPTE